MIRVRFVDKGLGDTAVAPRFTKVLVDDVPFEGKVTVRMPLATPARLLIDDSPVEGDWIAEMEHADGRVETVASSGVKGLLR